MLFTNSNSLGYNSRIIESLSFGLFKLMDYSGFSLPPFYNFSSSKSLKGPSETNTVKRGFRGGAPQPMSPLWKSPYSAFGELQLEPTETNQNWLVSVETS